MGSLWVKILLGGSNGLEIHPLQHAGTGGEGGKCVAAAVHAGPVDSSLVIRTKVYVRVLIGLQETSQFRAVLAPSGGTTPPPLRPDTILHTRDAPESRHGRT